MFFSSVTVFKGVEVGLYISECLHVLNNIVNSIQHKSGVNLQIKKKQQKNKKLKLVMCDTN